MKNVVINQVSTFVFWIVLFFSMCMFGFEERSQAILGAFQDLWKCLKSLCGGGV